LYWAWNDWTSVGSSISPPQSCLIKERKRIATSCLSVSWKLK
jgi:hypothetical protein